MYLKSLSCRGFKSFADKVSLSLKPGISAVVGPNGSGKSNISDAVLWVLGERNAKNLRGQAMDDVIFAGSSTRSQSQFAEVELVLDNTDHTIPLDYSEIAIARRIYRSGESEYLINGAQVRRLDIIELLHDTGLGAGAHSIISQGALDQILQSKPEERRALIEEAAGTLKHKQRRLKSERKIEAMDQHLVRVRDLERELERRLKPLEKKAKKAQEYQELSQEIQVCTLKLAVDDLRALQASWDALLSQEQSLSQGLEAQKTSLQKLEETSSAIQAEIMTEREQSGALTQALRRSQSALEKFGSQLRLLHEKERSCKSRVADLTLRQEELTRTQAQFAAEVEQARTDLEKLKLQFEAAKDARTQLLEQKQELQTRNQVLQARSGRLRSERRKLQNSLDEKRRRLSVLQDAFQRNSAQAELFAQQEQQYSDELVAVRAELHRANQEVQELEAKLKSITDKDAQARRALSDSLNEVKKQEDALHVARGHAADVRARMLALEQMLKEARSGNPLLERAFELRDASEVSYVSLSETLLVPSEWSHLVEYALSHSLHAQLCHSATDAQTLMGSLLDSTREGSLELRYPQGSDEPRAKAAQLLDLLDYPSEWEPNLESVLGQFYLADTLPEALELAESLPATAQILVREGYVVSPAGSLSYVSPEVAQEGALARVQEIARTKEQLKAHEEQIAEIESELGRLRDANHQFQKESLELSQHKTAIMADLSAATARKENLDNQERKLESEFTRMGERRSQAQDSLSASLPEKEELEQSIASLEEELQTTSQEIFADQRELEPLQEELHKLGDKLNTASLEYTRLEERKLYAERVLETRERERVTQASQLDAIQETLARTAQFDQIIKPFQQVFSTLEQRAEQTSKELEESTGTHNEKTGALHAQLQEKRGELHAAQEKLDALNAELATLRVDKGRLELKVESALNFIVKDCETPLERAFELDKLEDRASVQEQKEALEKRVRSLGTINPDAASEYAEIKERFDYIHAQTSDLTAARATLERIVQVLDIRMREDFLKTFEQVNANFQRIFESLFPGGTAELILLDPDNLDETGIEVSAQPKGKRITKMMLMSGGEKSLVALALLFAVYRIRKAPFYILDEVEAALDDINLVRLVNYLDSLRQDTQLIMITHQRRTMEMADALFGVSMQSDGITRVISQKLKRKASDTPAH